MHDKVEKQAITMLQTIHISSVEKDFILGTISDSTSSRESSPDRDDVIFQEAAKVLKPNLDLPLDDFVPKAIPKEVKARRRTATPQVLTQLS